MINLNTITMFASRNMSAILTGISVTTGIAAVAEGCVATVKATKVLEEMHYKSETEPSFKDKAVAISPLYAKTAALLCISIGCQIGSLSNSERKIMALASIASKYEKELEHSDEAIKDILGEGKLKKVKEEVARKELNENPPKDEDFYDTGTGKTKFRDTIIGGEFLADIEFVKSAFNKVQGMINDDEEGIVAVEDLLLAMHRPPIGIGSDLCWAPREDLELDIQPEPIKKDGMEVTDQDMKEVIYLIKYKRPSRLFE